MYPGFILNGTFKDFYFFLHCFAFKMIIRVIYYSDVRIYGSAVVCWVLFLKEMNWELKKIKINF